MDGKLIPRIVEKPEEGDQDKKTFGYHFTRLMVNLNLRISVKFFLNVLATLQIELLMSAFGNFRFAKVNSGFGLISIVCSILVLGLVIYVMVVSAVKMLLTKAIK